MAHLTDMEELLATVIASEVRDYMREAMNCYMSNAYRGCVVLSFIALFDDLVAKLQNLSKVNSKAKKIYTAVEKKRSDQEVFETYLIDQLGSNMLLPKLDTTFLKILRDLRNKAAHPSGHKPSPEEARYVFHEVITRFLSKPILSTTQLVEEIFGRLKNNNFFPSTNIEDTKIIVKEEINVLHKEALPILVVKLVDAIISSDKTVSRNASFFITGLSYLNIPSMNKLISEKLIKAKSDDSEYSNIILRSISANGSLFKNLSNTTVKRFKKILSKQIDDVKPSLPENKFSHPVSVVNSLIKVLPDAELITELSPELEKLFNKHPYSNNIISSLHDKPDVGKMYLAAVKSKASSIQFNTANTFANKLEEIDTNLSKLTSPRDAFEIIICTLKAASHGAFDSQAIRDAKFEIAPEIKSLTVEYISENQSEAEQYLDDEFRRMSANDFLSTYLDDEEY